MSSATKKPIPENKIVAIFLSFCMGWGATPHPVALLITSMLRLSYQSWGDRPLTEIGHSEAASLLLRSHSELLPQIMENSFDAYLTHHLSELTNYEAGHAWFIALAAKHQAYLFKEYELEKVAQFLKLPQKSYTNFTKTLRPVSVTNRVTAYLAWYEKYKLLRSK